MSGRLAKFLWPSQNIQSLIQLLFWSEILHSWVPTLILEEFGIHLRCLAEKLNVEGTANYLDIYVQIKQMNTEFFNNVSSIISRKADEVTCYTMMVFSKNPWLIVSWKYA